MKTFLQTLFFGFFFILPTTAMAQSTSEHDAVKLVMQNLLRAFETGDADLLRKTFRSDGTLVGYSKKSGKVILRSGEEFATGFTGKPADDDAQRKRSFEILDVTENAALAKLMLDYPTWKGIDYMALSKIDGEWKIISKSWNAQAKPTPKK